MDVKIDPIKLTYKDFIKFYGPVIFIKYLKYLDDEKMRCDDRFPVIFVTFGKITRREFENRKYIIPCDRKLKVVEMKKETKLKANKSVKYDYNAKMQPSIWSKHQYDVVDDFRKKGLRTKWVPKLKDIKLTHKHEEEVTVDLIHESKELVLFESVYESIDQTVIGGLLDFGEDNNINHQSIDDVTILMMQNPSDSKKPLMMDVDCQTDISCDPSMMIDFNEASTQTNNEIIAADMVDKSTEYMKIHADRSCSIKDLQRVNKGEYKLMMTDGSGLYPHEKDKIKRDLEDYQDEQERIVGQEKMRRMEKYNPKRVDQFIDWEVKIGIVYLSKGILLSLSVISYDSDGCSMGGDSDIEDWSDIDNG